jgi:hypothetical protein
LSQQGLRRLSACYRQIFLNEKFNQWVIDGSSSSGWEEPSRFQSVDSNGSRGQKSKAHQQTGRR